ncbi:MAG: hypothetical protein JOZ58_03895 [Acetobacteraceae bacterium]|nr:hypothetical protein [Acetobacteraceae bacterium]
MDKDYAKDLTAMRQQIMALASIIGILVTALREGGLMTENFEALLSSELADAAAAQSEQAQMEWERIVAAVQKVASATATRQ